MSNFELHAKVVMSSADANGMWYTELSATEPWYPRVPNPQAYQPLEHVSFLGPHCLKVGDVYTISFKAE